MRRLVIFNESKLSLLKLAFPLLKMRRLDFFNESKLSLLKLAFPLLKMRRLVIFQPITPLNLAMKDLGKWPLGQVRYAHARGVRNNEIKEM
jgi:hypothetical protein